MSSNSAAAHATSKGLNASSQSSASAQGQSGPSFTTESYSHRRPGGSGSFGAGSASRSGLASARRNQSSRKQHRSQRRSEFADEDAIAESAAMRSTNSRKGQQSITHLMNFSLPPRPHYSRTSHNRNARWNPTWSLSSAQHAVDKARYVHANYRFIVDPRGDYRAQAVDADIHLEWSSVLQILASAQTQCSTCPICLSTPVAPRMAKCGHIFCLPCLIRYMHSTDDATPFPERKARWKKCPICWDSIYMADTQPVRWFTGQENEPPRESDDVVLRLVMRRLGSTLALPRDGAESNSEVEEIPWHFAAEVMDYARVMKGSEDYMMEQFEDEISQVQQREREDELIYGDETEWTKRAVGAIREAQQRIKGIGNPPSFVKQPTESKPRKEPISFNETEDVPDMYTIKHAIGSGQSRSTVLNSAIPSLFGGGSEQPQPFGAESDTRSRAQGSSNQATKGIAPQDSAYYFYQALPHYYLSPLDIRILKAAFGAFASFPATILPRVDHVSTGHVVDDELRKRTKYLAHLPSGCEVAFLECDWTDVVAPEILERFKPEIERRRKKNRDKDIREEKDRVRAEKALEDQRWAAARRKRSNSLEESIKDGDFVPLRPPETPDLTFTAGDNSNTSTSPPWPASTWGRNGSAFATLASPSTSPVAPRTVWGTPAALPSSPPPPAIVQHEPEASDHDGWLQGWEQDLLQEDDLVAQIQAASMGEAGSSRNVQGSSSRKKKGKKITLMSTDARRGA